MNTYPKHHSATSSGQADAAAGDAPRVVVILPTYLPESFGGAEQQSRRFAMTLAARGARVTLLAPRTLTGTPKSEYRDGVRIERFTLANLPNLGGRHFPSFLLWTLRLIWWLWRHRAQYDVVHVIHARLHAVGAVLGSRLAGKPCIIKFGRGGTQFDIDVVARKRLLGRQFASVIRRYATGFVANSTEMIEDMARHGISESRTYRIPNGVIMPDEKRTDRAPPGLAAFLFMGRLDSGKAIDIMLKGFASLPADTQAHLTIVGDGPDRSKLEYLATSLQLEKRVTFAGRMEDVTPAILKADFYLSTSLSEGMSNSLLESMSFGVVPIVTCVSGAADLVSNGVNGILFDAGSTVSCEEALRKAATVPPDRYLEMSENARMTMESRFSMDMVVERHLTLYRRLMVQANTPLPVARGKKQKQKPRSDVE